MLRKKNKHKGAFHALSIGATQGKEVCYRRRYGKKGGGGGHKAQHAKTTNQPPKDLHTLSLYRGRKHDGTKREVRNTRHAYHAFLLHVYRISSFCFLNTTMPTDDANQV